MDCVRISTDEHKDLKLKGNYTFFSKVSSLEECRNACVSDLDCTGWSYTNNKKNLFDKKGECYITDSKSQELEISPKSFGGIVKCKNLPNYGYILMWLGICAIVLFVVWYFLNVFEPKKYKLDERLFFSNLHFRSVSEI